LFLTIIAVNPVNGRCSTSAMRDVFWEPNEVKDWEDLEEENGYKWKRATINSEHSSVQILALIEQADPDVDTMYRISWAINIFLDRGYGVDFISIWYGDTGSVLSLYTDSIDDGIFTFHTSEEPNTGPIQDPANREIDDSEIEYGSNGSRFNLQKPECINLNEISKDEYELAIFYDVKGTVFKNFTTTWRINFDDTSTSVKIFNDYYLNRSWEGFGNSLEDSFFLVEGLQYLYTTPDNFVPSGQGFYIGEKTESYKVDKEYEMKATNGNLFGTITIPEEYYAVYNRSGTIIKEANPLVGCKYDEFHYDAAYNTLSEDYFISMNNLTCNRSLNNQLLRIYYDPEFSFEHDIKTMEFIITASITIAMVILVPVIAIIIIHKKQNAIGGGEV